MKKITANHNIQEIERANEILGQAGFRVSAVQNHFSLLYRSSERGRKYNPVLDKLQTLTDEMKTIGEKYGASCSQIGIAWAIAKGTMPIVGATKERHVAEAAAAADIVLTKEEVARLETLADATGIDTRGDWEHTMD